jgi:hypothetical protein
LVPVAQGGTVRRRHGLEHASGRGGYAAKLAEKEALSSSDLPSSAEAGFAKAGAVEQVRKRGMAEMSEKFRASGGEMYVKEE